MGVKDYIAERTEEEDVSREEADRRTWIDIHGPLIDHAVAVQESRQILPLAGGGGGTFTFTNSARAPVTATRPEHTQTCYAEDERTVATESAPDGPHAPIGRGYLGPNGQVIVTLERW